MPISLWLLNGGGERDFFPIATAIEMQAMCFHRQDVENYTQEACRSQSSSKNVRVFVAYGSVDLNCFPGKRS